VLAHRLGRCLLGSAGAAIAWAPVQRNTAMTLAVLAPRRRERP